MIFDDFDCVDMIYTHSKDIINSLTIALFELMVLLTELTEKLLNLYFTSLKIWKVNFI